MSATETVETRAALPHSDDAEFAVLACVLLDNRQFETVAGLLETRDFYRTLHRCIFRALARLAAGESPLDLVTLRDELERSGELETLRRELELGTAADVVNYAVAYSSKLMDGHARSANVEHYAKIVKEKATKRALIGLELAEMAGNGSSLEALAQAVAEAGRILEAATPVASPLVTAVSLVDVAATVPEFDVRDFIRRSGVTLMFGPAGVAKTFLSLRLATEMLTVTGGDTFKGAPKLFGHPELSIRRPWRRVLWVSAEETSGTLRFRWDMVLAGMQIKPEDLRGELLFVWPFSERASFTVDQLESALDAIGGDFDAVIFDSWTSLVPSMFEGRLVEWERDTFATRRLVNLLREIAFRRKLNIVIVHHEGLEKGRGRGNTELNRNTPDTILSLESLPERRVKIRVTKQRDGRDKWEFVLALEHGDAFRVRHEQREERKLTTPQRDVLMFLRARGSASVAEIEAGTKHARTTVQNALKALESAGEAINTGEKNENNSVVWSVPDGAHGVPENE